MKKENIYKLVFLEFHWSFFWFQVRRKKEESGLSTGEPREMVTPMLKKALEKQGYRLIGSHSGVKLCRWTKVKVHFSFYAVLFANYFIPLIFFGRKY